MHCGKTKKAVELKTKSGFSFINLIMSIEESMATIIMKSFPGGKMIAQQLNVAKESMPLYLFDNDS